MSRFKRWGLALLLLYLVYEPELSTLFLGIHQYYVNSLVILICLVFRIRQFRIEKRFMKAGIVLLECAVYTLVITMVTNNEPRFFQHAYFLIQALALYLLNDYVDKTAENPAAEKLLLLKRIVLFETMAVAVMILIPAAKQFGVDLYYAGRDSEVNQYIVSKRIYGIFGDYTFKCQVINGVFAAFFACWAYITGNKSNYLYTIMALFISAMNGRTGLLITIVMIFLFLVIRAMQNPVKIGEAVKMTLIILIGAIIAAIAVYFVNRSTFDFVLNMFRNFLNIDTGNDNNLKILSNSIIWPDAWGWIFGTGKVLYGKSDIGYCNDIYLVGALVTAIEYGAMISLIWIRRKNNHFVALNLCIAAALLIINVKGVCMRNGSVVMGMLWLRMICESFGEVESRYPAASQSIKSQ